MIYHHANIFLTCGCPHSSVSFILQDWEKQKGRQVPVTLPQHQALTQSIPQMAVVVEEWEEEPQRGSIYDLNVPAVVKFAYTAEREDELTLVKGSQVVVMEKCSDGWWRGSHGGRVGWFPSNYVQEELGGADDRGEGDASRGYSGSQGTLLANGRAGDQGGVLHLVQTLYPFSSVTEEELNFEKGEVMEVVEKPENDPEWWRCKNSRGMVGLVPKNYVMVLDERPGVPPSGSPQKRHLAPARSGKFAGRDWYYGSVTRHQAECILNERAVEGDFLIRDSESSVSILLQQRGIRHYLSVLPIRVRQETSPYFLIS